MGFFRREDSRQTGEPIPDALRELRRKVAKIGRADYPFLSREYGHSDTSRIPAMDYTGFIVERLQANDWTSIYGLMEGIIEANPGMGLGPEWIRAAARKAASVPFSQYVHFSDQSAYLELQALWILGSKWGDDRMYWLTQPFQFATTFAKAMSCYKIEWKPALDQLIERANKQIRKMKARAEKSKTAADEVSFWDDYPLFTASAWDVPSLSESEASHIMKQLPVFSRVHLLETVHRGGGSLPRLVGHHVLQFGLHRHQSSTAILASGLMTKPPDSAPVLKELRKKELLAECKAAGANYYKSWTKPKLLGALRKAAPERVNQLIEEKEIAAADPRYRDDLAAILAYSKKLETPFNLLALA